VQVFSVSLVGPASGGSIGAIVEPSLVKAKSEVGSTLKLTNHWKSDEKLEKSCQFVQTVLPVMMVEVATASELSGSIDQN